MRARSATLWSCVVLIVSNVACSGERQWARDDEAGGVAQASAAGYCIWGAFTESATVHFQGPDWLLTSSEGVGPVEIDARVQQYVQPAMSTSTTVRLDPTAVSNAVGYAMAERYELIAGGRYTVTAGQTVRLEAYAAYQRAVWEIRDAACEVPLGTGASFKPIGVYFRVVPTEDIALPDPGYEASP